MSAYTYSPLNPCRMCGSESIRFLATIHEKKCAVIMQCRECGFKVESVADSLAVALMDAGAIWNHGGRAAA